MFSPVSLESEPGKYPILWVVCGGKICDSDCGVLSKVTGCLADNDIEIGITADGVVISCHGDATGTVGQPGFSGLLLITRSREATFITNSM